MTMTFGKKTLSLIGAGLLILLAAIWFIGNIYATRAAEEKITAALNSTPLADEIHWEKLNANIFGTVTMKNLALGKGKSFLTVQKLQLSGFENSPSSLQGKLLVTGLADANGQSPLLDNELLQNAGYNKADPVNFSLDIDAQKTQGTAQISLALDQREVIKLNASFALSQAQQLMSLLSSAMEGGKEAFNPMMFFSLGAMLEPIRINNTEIRLDDQGYIKRVNTLVKRYDIPLAPSENNLDTKKFAKEQHKARYEQALQQCTQSSSNGQFFDKPVDSCKAIAKFMFEESDSLKLKLKPFPLSQLNKLVLSVF